MTAKQLHQLKVKAGKARAQQFTTEYQRMARSFLPRDVMVRGGKAGYAATFKSGKLGKIQAKLTERNKQTASRFHTRVKQELQNSGVAFSECVFPYQDAMLEVDFMLLGKRVIEVDGCRFQDAPFGNTQRDFKGEFERKRKRLEADGYTVFVFDASRLRDELVRLNTWLFPVHNNPKQDDELPF